MLALVTTWSHLLAALLYGALTVWQVRRWSSDPAQRPLTFAFAAVTVWALFLSLLGPNSALSALAESARHLAFIAFMYGMVTAAEPDDRQRAVKLVYAAVAGVIGLQMLIGGALPDLAKLPRVQEALLSTGQIIGFILSAGALILVHNFYGQAAPESREAIRLPVIAMAAMWGYDLHLYTVAYFSRAPAADLFAFRGLLLSLLVPLFALGFRRQRGLRLQMSRAATFQSLSLLAIFAYLILMMSASRAIEIVGGDWTRVAQLGVLVAGTLLAMLLLPSPRLRAWAKVSITKHFFEHRYDYRSEWLRFTGTVATASEDQAGLEERVVKALADLGGAPSGLLLDVEPSGRLTPSASWNWAGAVQPDDEDAAAFLQFVQAGAHVVDFDAARNGGGRCPPPPAWLVRLSAAWAGIPLIHGGRLIGLVVLAHNEVKRALDWEDFDLFRTAGTQAASYLAEARGQRALAEAQRFDEFNRRFAFIIHDVKNLVSQISLVARNAERHADNPAFRADMIATLQSSVKKMNDLLARLSRGRTGEVEPPRPVPVHALLSELARARKRVHPVEVAGDPALSAFADPVRLEQAVAHLVQNAIDASTADQPVLLQAAERGGEVAIEIVDKGPGMSADFVRHRLFQPFASTKDGGFGVGAFEARALIAAMGGRVEVDSQPGRGTRFTLILPRAASPSLPLEHRLSA